MIQPALWEDLEGNIHAFFRTKAGKIYRSDSYTWKNNESIFFIYVDEPCFYEKNEKFDANAYYYEIDLYSATK